MLVITMDPPAALDGPPDAELGLPAPVVAAANGLTPVEPPLLPNLHTVATAKDPPGCGPGPPDGEIGLSVAIIVAGNGLIPDEPPLLLNLPTVATAKDPPGCGAGPPHAETALPPPPLPPRHRLFSL